MICKVKTFFKNYLLFILFLMLLVLVIFYNSMVVNAQDIENPSENTMNQFYIDSEDISKYQGSTDIYEYKVLYTIENGKYPFIITSDKPLVYENSVKTFFYCKSAGGCKVSIFQYYKSDSSSDNYIGFKTKLNVDNGSYVDSFLAIDSRFYKANYDFKDLNGNSVLSETKFPNWTYAYNMAKVYFDKNSYYKENIKYLIESFDKAGFKFIITMDKDGHIHPVLSKNKEAFSMNYSTSDNLRYTTPVIFLNNGNVNLKKDFYEVKNLTKEYVDEYVLEVKENFDKLSTGTLAQPFVMSKYDISKVAVLYSNFSDKFVINQYSEIIKIDDKDYFIEGVPASHKISTINTLYNVLDIKKEEIEENEKVEYPEIPGDAIPSSDPNIDDMDDVDPDKTTSLLNKVTSILMDKVPIIGQVKDILKKWEWNGTNDCIYTVHDGVNSISLYKCYLIPNLEFELFDYKYNLEGFDVTWYLKYRNMVSMWVKLSVGTYTLLKCFRIVGGMFHGK